MFTHTDFSLLAPKGAQMQKQLDNVASEREMKGEGGGGGVGHEQAGGGDEGGPAPEGMGAPFGLAM